MSILVLKPKHVILQLEPGKNRRNFNLKVNIDECLMYWQEESIKITEELRETSNLIISPMITKSVIFQPASQ
jgi:hypothetical protein